VTPQVLLPTECLTDHKCCCVCAGGLRTLASSAQSALDRVLSALHKLLCRMESGVLGNQGETLPQRDMLQVCHE
jgi:hypothetical protein